jgi:transcriptional/translational regulatory protein YebC/TACO1
MELAKLAVIVDCLTDNRNRAVADVRHAFTKFGGNLGTDGSVAFMFKHCGSLLFAPGTNEDQVMEAALEAGAEDIIKMMTVALKSLPPQQISLR